MAYLDSFDGKSVLVTGGAGFIGSHLVEALSEKGARVRVLDDLSTGSLDNLTACAQAIEFVEGDIRQLEDCRDAARGVEFVFHQAAMGSVPRSVNDPIPTIEVNTLGSANVFRAAFEAGARRTVYASSSSVYGDARELPKLEGVEGRPLSPYALSKQMAEDVARTFSRSYGQELVGLRYFNVYGPRQNPAGDYAAVIPRFFAAFLSGRAPTIFGDGEQSRDFTFVGDVVRANLLAACAPGSRLNGPVYNVAAGERTTINQLAADIASLTESEIRPEHAAERPGDVRHSQADIGLAQRTFDYRPTVDMPEGLERSAAYYRTLARPSAFA